MSSVPGRASAATGLFGAVRAWFHSDGIVLSDLEPRRSDARRGPARSALQVLVAHPDPLDRALLAHLERRGIVAVVALDGAEAVELACARTFDIVFMDPLLPVLDGLAATSRIRRFERMQSRPRVPVVAYGNASFGLDLLEAGGMNGALAKSCTADEFEDCMLRWCSDFVPLAFTTMPARHAPSQPRRAKRPCPASSAA